jgi:putative acetyltransferase
MLEGLTISRKSVTLEELTPDSTPPAIEAAQELLLEYGRFVQAQSGVASFCFGALEREAERLPESYWERGGGAILAWLDRFPAGFVAWRSAPGLDAAWELKRLWTRPEARGAGLGRRLVEAVEERARAAGKSRLVLDTAPEAMAAAHRLYLDLGFQPCPPYNGPALKGIIYMSKQL